MHLFGDYVTQSDWMAVNKTKEDRAALLHALIYSLPFLLLTGFSQHGMAAWVVILMSHFAIDRYALARYLVFAKNYLLSPTQSWKVLGVRMAWQMCRKTGYPREEPAWLFVWLFIVADNTMHLAINYAALRWL